MGNAKWFYIQSEPNLYTVGFYAPSGEWHTDSDHALRDKAAERVNYLNGDIKKTRALELEVAEAADLHLETILELQRIQVLLAPICDENERLIGVALSELENKFHKIHDKWNGD